MSLIEEYGLSDDYPEGSDIPRAVELIKELEENGYLIRATTLATNIQLLIKEKPPAIHKRVDEIIKAALS